MVRRFGLILVIVPLLALIPLTCLAAEEGQQQQQGEADKEFAADPGKRHTFRFSERAALHDRLNDEATLSEIRASRSTQVNLYEQTYQLMEPGLATGSYHGSSFVGRGLGHFMQEEDRYENVLRERGGPRESERYALCVSEKSNEFNPTKAAEICSGIDKSGPQPEEDNNYNDDDENQEDDDIVLSRETSVAEELAAKFQKKAERTQYIKDFRRAYGDMKIITKFHKNGKFTTEFPEQNSCEASGRAGACKTKDRKRKLDYGFDGKLHRYQKDTLEALGKIITTACEDINERSQRAQSEGPLGMYKGNEVDFDFWSTIELIPGAEYEKNPDSSENIIVNRLSIKEGHTFDKDLGKLFVNVLEIDGAGKNGAAAKMDCSRTREAYSNNYYEQLYEIVELNDTSDDLERFLFAYGKIVGGLRALTEVEDEIKEIYEKTMAEEDEALEILTMKTINQELGTLDEIGVSSIVSNKSVDDKIVVAKQYLYKELAELLGKIKKHVMQGRGEKLPSLATNVRSAGSIR